MNAGNTRLGQTPSILEKASLHFSPDVTDSAPQIGCHKGFSQGVEYRAYLPTEEHPLWDQRSSGIGRIG